jgi:ADP-ribose pyrophosphatase
MGRTGVHGRGALFRWGPNHEIRVMVSRWRKHAQKKYIHVDGRRMLEFLACKDPLYGEWKLPGGKILGHISPYAIVCSSFTQLIFEQVDFEYKEIESEEQMKNFFKNFANVNESSAFTAKMIYKGYIDDPRNTDNAWVEAEIWNFHYGDQDKLNDSIPNVNFIIKCFT